MKDNIKVMIYFVAFIAFLVFAYVGYNILLKSKSHEQLETAQIADDDKNETKEKLREFNLYLEDDEKISSKELLVGKPIVINIWTSWCRYCDVEMEYFNEIYLRERENINFVMINATGDRDSKISAKEYVESNGFEFEIYYDLNLEAINILGIYSYPTTIFVNKDGYIDSYNIGMITREKLERKIQNLK